MEADPGVQRKQPSGLWLRATAHAAAQTGPQPAMQVTALSANWRQRDKDQKMHRPQAESKLKGLS